MIWKEAVLALQRSGSFDLVEKDRHVHHKEDLDIDYRSPFESSLKPGSEERKQGEDLLQCCFGRLLLPLLTEPTTTPPRPKKAPGNPSLSRIWFLFGGWRGVSLGVVLGSCPGPTAQARRKS